MLDDAAEEGIPNDDEIEWKSDSKQQRKQRMADLQAMHEPPPGAAHGSDAAPSVAHSGGSDAADAEMLLLLSSGQTTAGTTTAPGGPKNRDSSRDKEANGRTAWSVPERRTSGGGAAAAVKDEHSSLPRRSPALNGQPRGIRAVGWDGNRGNGRHPGSSSMAAKGRGRSPAPADSAGPQRRLPPPQAAPRTTITSTATTRRQVADGGIR